MQLDLINTNKKVLLDEEDYLWLSKYEWMESFYRKKSRGIERIFIKQVNKKIYLHSFMFPNLRHLAFIQLDENPYNYHRDNIEHKTYYKAYIRKEKNNIYKDKLKQGGIYSKISDDIIIKSSDYVMRQDECEWCLLVNYDEWYKKCLDLTAKENWKGWTFTKCLVGEKISKIIKKNSKLKEHDMLKLLQIELNKG